jgi:hypothetical protein
LRAPCALPSLLLDQAIADARLGLNELRLRGILLDLPAQLSDEDAKILRVLLMRWAPYRAQDLSVRQDSAGLPRKGREQLIFLRRKAHRLAVARDEALAESAPPRA